MTEERIREYLLGLKDGERVIETGQSCQTGWLGTVYHNDNGSPCVLWDRRPGETGQLGTSATWGTRRIDEPNPPD